MQATEALGEAAMPQKTLRMPPFAVSGIVCPGGPSPLVNCDIEFEVHFPAYTMKNVHEVIGANKSRSIAKLNSILQPSIAPS
jgi:hypothetical protein